ISHRLGEVFRIADRATVLRDGQVMATLTPAQTTRDALIRLMVGRELRESRRGDGARVAREPVLEVHDLCAEGFLSDIPLRLHRGELLGVAGLVGAGRTTLARALFGATPLTAGRIILQGKSVAPGSPASAVQAGVALVPEDRKGQGLVLNLSVAQNI